MQEHRNSHWKRTPFVSSVPTVSLTLTKHAQETRKPMVTAVGRTPLTLGGHKARKDVQIVAQSDADDGEAGGEGEDCTRKSDVTSEQQCLGRFPLGHSHDGQREACNSVSSPKWGYCLVDL